MRSNEIISADIGKCKMSKSANMTKQQIEYARRSRDRQDFQKEVNKKALEYAKQRAEEESRYKGMKYKPLGVAYLQPPKEKAEAIMRLVDVMLEDHTCKQTQKALIAKVQNQYPKLKLHQSIFSQPREKWFMDKVQKRITGNAKEAFSVEGCKSLAEARQRLKAKSLRQSTKKQPITLKPVVTFTSKALIVDGKSFPYYSKTAHGKTYKCIKFMKRGKQYSLPVKAIAALLNDG